jgi:predicted ABC-type ATPase
MSEETLSVKLQSTNLKESWGELINPYEFAQDLRDDFGGVVFSAYSTIYDRSDGRYRPVYETEMDLRRVRAMAWTLAETVPGAQAWVNRLVDYTIGTGFDWSATSKENPQLAKAVKGWIDQVLENSNWSSGLERESFAREVADGEYVGQLEQSSGSCCITTYEPDELTAPLRVRDLDEWLDLDFVSSWSFGVLTRQNRPAKHYGYHFVHDAAGSDWSYVPVEDAIFWRRNGRSNAKRGFSDFHRVFLHLARSNLVLTNTAEGAATQAAIAYIVEHAQSTSRGDIERMTQADSYVGNTPDPMTGLLARKKRMRPGTRIDTKGGKYQAGPLGTNNSQVYISVMEALLRIAGSVHAFPEGMLTGSYANNNFASSLTAEAPFVQGRMADQASRAMRVKSLLKRIVTVGHKFGVFRSFGQVTLEQVLGTVELSVIPSKIVHRDPKEMTEALKMQKDAGWVSDKTAMTELGRDFDVEMENGAKAADAGQEASGQQQGLPGQQTGQDAAGASPDGSAAVWMGLSRQQFVRNQKALLDIVSGLSDGTLKRNAAKVMLASIGMPKESIDLLMQDMVDKKLDADMPSEAGMQESLKRQRECKDACGCRSKRVKSLRERYRRSRSQRMTEAFCPTGEGGGRKNTCSPKRKAPSRPAFHSSDKERNAANDKDVNKLLSMFHDGDVEGLMQVKHPSQKVVDYAAALRHELTKVQKPSNVIDDYRTSEDMHMEDGKYTKERRAVHDKIFAHFLEGAKPVESPTFVLLGGGSASGKSNLNHETVPAIPRNIVRVDSDAIKAMLPEYESLHRSDQRAAAFVHNESAYLAKSLAAVSMSRSYNTMLDGTGNGSPEGLAKKVAIAKKSGAKVVAVYATTDIGTAMQRNRARAKTEGRMVPESFVQFSHAQVSSLFPKFVEGKHFDEAHLFDTTSSPRKIATYQADKLEVHDEKAYRDFLGKAKAE